MRKQQQTTLMILDLIKVEANVKSCDLWCTGNLNARCSVQVDIKSKTHVMELRYGIFHFRLKIDQCLHSLNSAGKIVVWAESPCHSTHTRWRYPVLLSDSKNTLIPQGCGFPFRYWQKETTFVADDTHELISACRQWKWPQTQWTGGWAEADSCCAWWCHLDLPRRACERFGKIDL